MERSELGWVMQFQNWLDPEFVKGLLAARENPDARTAFIRKQVEAQVAPPPEDLFEKVRPLFKKEAVK